MSSPVSPFESPDRGGPPIDKYLDVQALEERFGERKKKYGSSDQKGTLAIARGFFDCANGS
jgi:hypothetical protein